MCQYGRGWKEQTFIAEDCNSLKLKLLKFNNNRNITDNDFNPPRVLSPGILEASPAVVGGVAAGTELNFIFKMAPVQTCFVLAASYLFRFTVHLNLTLQTVTLRLFL